MAVNKTQTKYDNTWKVESARHMYMTIHLCLGQAADWQWL